MVSTNQDKRHGFTLIELLVVIAVIAVLMAILMPSLRVAKQQAAATNCLANSRTLSIAWFMYANENNNRLVPARMSTEGWIDTPQSVTGQEYTATQTSPPVLDEDEIRGIKKGLLFPYTEDADVYHCPADTVRISKHDQTRVFTSYSIPACLMGWEKNSTYYNKQIKIITSIKSPSTKYNFVESAETRNFNMNGRFVMGAPEYDSSTWEWWGPMAINHNKGSILGFCDGHSEKHKWKDKFTIDRVDKLLTQNVDLYGREAPPADQQEDIRYMARGWAYEKK